MRLISLFTAAAIGLTASYGLANAQATNVNGQIWSDANSSVSSQSMTRQKKMKMKRSMKRNRSMMMRSSQPRQVRGQMGAAGTGTARTPVQAGSR